MSVISVKNLTKKFGNFTAVDNISFNVENNRVVGFLGPNGAGKTTTLRMIVGLSKPTSGEISLNDNKIEFGNSGLNNLFGYLPELPAFYNWMKGKEYLSFIADTFNISKKQQKTKITEVLKLVNLENAQNKRIGAYSGGMKQRLGIAQALINDPKILILDEPVSALDPIGRKEVLNVIQTLSANKTIFLSTHILSDVDKICDDVVIINEGKIAAASSLPELKEKYTKLILYVEFSENPAKLVPKLKKVPWALRVEVDATSAKIWLRSEDDVRKNLPIKFFADESVGIYSYGIKLPEIEDLFLDLVRKGK
ncbi:MAG: ABC transporter ATP-binding protein [Patescibacteria group bacterium]|jgi:ABC-2 type transport system ATP-binding protein